MATLVRLHVVPDDTDPFEPGDVVTLWAAMPYKFHDIDRLYDEWVTSHGGEFYRPLKPQNQVDTTGPLGDSSDV